MAGSGRHWGPFSGAQLTTMVCVIVAAVAFPVAASAVSGSNVFVTDATSGKTAKVSSAGAVSVSGSVTATQTPPGTSYTNRSFVTESAGCNAVTTTIPANKVLVVTQITVTIQDVTTGPVFAIPSAATPGSPCVFLGSPADLVAVPGDPGTEIIPIPSGFPVIGGHVLGVMLTSGSSDATGFVTVHGYVVPSSQCTATGPPIGCH